MCKRREFDYNGESMTTFSCPYLGGEVELSDEREQHMFNQVEVGCVSSDPQE